MKINKKIAKGLSISLCVVITGGVFFVPKTYGGEDIPSVREYYELQLDLEENENQDKNQTNKQEDLEFSIDEEPESHDDNDNYNQDNNYDDNDNGYDNSYNENNYDDYNYEDNFNVDDSHNNDNNFNDYDNYDNYNDNNYSFSDFDYSFGNSSYDDYNWGYGGDNFDFFDYNSSLDGFGSFEEQREEHIPGSNFLKTPKTIQYTFDLESEYPKYIDTGIMVSEEGTIDSDGIKEVFKQIAIAKNAKFIEDTDRVMVLIDEKIIVAEGNVTKIETLEKIFKETSVKIKGQDTRAGGKFNLADYLEENGEITVEVNGEKIDLVTSPKLDNSRVLFPIRSIGEAMGAKVEWNDEKAEATITKDDKVIIIKGNSDKVLVNDEEYLLSNKTYLNNQERRILSLLNLIVTELDGEIKWNSTDSVLVIETSQEEIDLDEGL